MVSYSKYKSSGIEWLDRIPEHWNISKLKYLGELYGGLSGKSGVDFNNDENPKNKPYIPYTNIFNNTYISKDHFHYVSIEEGETQNRVKKYDMFFLMSSETFKDLGKSCILIDDVDELYLNSFCKGYRIKDKNIYPLFLNYQILGHLHREMISVEGKGFTRINLRQDKINDLVVFYPTYEEQIQIVKFLDEKTELIDKLISTKEKKIDLLKQQRTSLINEVITKGLNPKVKMKESGVEWIGEIPEHWEIKKLKHLCDIEYGISPPDTTYNDEGHGEILINGPVEYSETDFGYTRSLKWTTEPKKFSKKGSLLFCLRGSTTGRMNITHDDVSIGRGVCSINSRYNQWFMIYSMFIVRIYIQKLISGSTFPSVVKEDVDNYQICNPPIDEQNRIVEYLDLRTKEIDDLVSMEQMKIDLLKEYRQSLISEVITGKIDVRTNLN
jgi:type I restriction enzyme S subunit